MNRFKLALIASAALCALQAQALTVSVTAYDGTDATAHTQVVGAVENTFDPVTAIGTYSDLSQLVTGTPGWAAQPAGSTGYYLSVGPSGDQPASQTLSFGAGASYFGFLWGSPDNYNTLTVTTNLAEYAYTGALIMSSPDGDRAVSGYANFTAGAGEVIQSVMWQSTSNAFETDNHAVIAVPEPETYALMLAGLAAVGFIARRRRVL
ncbi:MAG: PEP-CTERM sorting domain-containing protein [Burkholderiaceae bacterium]|nr:PEP-CTERM sorting domain-containing protein [Burkholderiaceae bacterium]